MVFLKFWSNLSISKKLFSVFGLMACLIGLELIVLSFAMRTLSSVRTLVHGEGLWSKAQKDAIHNLQNFITTGDRHFFSLYERHLEIPLSFRTGRLELLKPNPDLKLVTNAFIMGGIHPHDVEGMISLILHYNQVSYVKKALQVWARGDHLIQELANLGQEIQKKVKDQGLQLSLTDQLTRKLNNLNAYLTSLELDFSSTLGEGSRALEYTIWMVLLMVVFTVETTGLFLTFRFGRRLTTELKELANTATAIGKGNLDKKVEVSSHDELGQLSAALNNMTAQLKSNIHLRQEAEHLNKVKTMFLANMSHEIRTPLATIMGFSEIMGRNLLGEAEQKQYLEIIKKAGQNLTDLISDILDISKVESGALDVHFKEFSLFKMLKEIQSMLSLKCQEKNIELKFEIKPHVPEKLLSDSTRVRQILLNLLNNAIKFTESGSVTLAVDYQDGYYIFDFFDTGIGIAPEDSEIIFDAFQQAASNHKRNYGGTGLGLPLSKHLIRLLGGDLELIKSELGGGSHFRARLKASVITDSVTPEIKIQSNEVDLKGFKILLAEDNKELSLYLKQLLESKGCIVSLANNGSQALEGLRQKTHQVSLMDLNMPEMNGLDVVKQARSEGIQIPIICISAHALQSIKDECLASGFNEFISKPISTDILFNLLFKYKKEKFSFSFPFQKTSKKV